MDPIYCVVVIYWVGLWTRIVPGTLPLFGMVLVVTTEPMYSVVVT